MRKNAVDWNLQPMGRLCWRAAGFKLVDIARFNGQKTWIAKTCLYAVTGCVYKQGWKYWLVIDNRYFILCFSAIDYRRCFALNFFDQSSPFSMLLLYILSIVRVFKLLFLLSLPNLTSFCFSYAILLFILLSKKCIFLSLMVPVIIVFPLTSFIQWSIRQKF